MLLVTFITRSNRTRTETFIVISLRSYYCTFFFVSVSVVARIERWNNITVVSPKHYMKTWNLMFLIKRAIRCERGTVYTAFSSLKVLSTPRYYRKAFQFRRTDLHNWLLTCYKAVSKILLFCRHNLRRGKRLNCPWDYIFNSVKSNSRQIAPFVQRDNSPSCGKPTHQQFTIIVSQLQTSR